MSIADAIDQSTKALQKGDIEVGFGDAQLQNRSERLTSPGQNAIRPNGIPIRTDLTYPPIGDDFFGSSDAVSPTGIFSFIMFEVFGRKGNSANINYDVSRVISDGADAAQFSFAVGNEVEATTRSAENNSINNSERFYGGSGFNDAGSATSQQLIESQGDRRIGKALEKLQDRITLYVPHQLQFNDSVQYEDKSMGDAARILEAMAGNRGAITDEVQLRALGAASSFAAGLPLGGLSGIEDTVKARLGFTENPRNEALFKNTERKSFNMSFNFAPRNPDEVEIVFNIVESFRFHMLPELSASASVLFAPDEFELTFMYKKPGESSVEENLSIPKLGRCFLNSVNVDYAPNSRSAFFIDGSPCEIKMDLNFMQAFHMHRAMVLRGF